MRDNWVMRGFFSRFPTRLFSFLSLGLMVWLWPSAWRFLVPSLSPYVALCSAIALRSLSFVLLLSVPMLLLVVWRRRFWCHYLCPVGLISEYCGKLRLSRTVQARGADTETTPHARREQDRGERDRARRNRRAAFPSSLSPGRFLALATLGGSLVGYPLFLWMDPLALFSGFFNVAHVARPGISLLSMAGLPTVMLISLLFPGTWCARICPLGGTQELLAQAGRMLHWSKAKNPGTLPSVDSAGRRSFLAVAVGAVFSAFIPKAWAKEKRPLRPPGNVNETTFKGDCIRCGSCVRVCPAGIIEPVVDSHDAAGFLVPGLRFSGPKYCLQDCNLCGKVCPTGVIRKLPLERKNRHIIGIAEIDLSKCLLVADEECGVCMPRCPRGAIVEVFSRETYTTIVKVLRDKCNGCGACVGVCPPKVVKVHAVS